MFEQTSRLAEKLAAGLSRRWFLGTLGGCENGDAFVNHRPFAALQK